MRKLILLPAFLAVLMALVISAPATPTLLIGTLVTVNNTTAYSSTNACFTYNQALQQFTVTHGALTATNAFWLTIQATLDQTNYVNCGTWYPTTTNAATETFSGSSFTPTNYFRVACTSTNSVQVGGSYGQ